MNNVENTISEKELKTREQINKLLGDIEDHQTNMTRATESLKQAARGTVSLSHFKDLKKALGSFTKARKSVESAKRLVKNWALDDLKEDR